MPRIRFSPTTAWSTRRLTLCATALGLALACADGAAAATITSTVSGDLFLSIPGQDPVTGSKSQNSAAAQNLIQGIATTGVTCEPFTLCYSAGYAASYTNRPSGVFSLQTAVGGSLLLQSSTSGSAVATASVSAFDTLLLTGDPGDHRAVTLHKTLSLTQVENDPETLIEGEGTVSLQQSLRLESQGIGLGPDGDDRFAFGSYSTTGTFQQTSVDTVDFNLNLILGQPKDIEILMTMAADLEGQAMLGANGRGLFEWNEDLNFLDGLSVTDTVSGLPMCGLTINSSSGVNYGSVAACQGGGGMGGSAVPEPASWALSIVGFYGAGAALRRRSRPAALT